MDLSALRKNTHCKVCRLSDWNMPLFMKVHELSLSDGYDAAAVSKFVNSEIEKQNTMAQIASDQREFITRQQISTHFSKHIPMEELAKQKVRRVINGPAAGDKPMDPVVARKLQDLAEHAEAVGVSDLDDFQRYHDTLGRMEKRFNELDKFFDDPDFAPTKDLILQYKGFGDSIGRMLAESIKLRQQERLMHNAVTSTLDTFSITALQGILKSVEKAFQDARPHMSDATKADLIVASLREAIAVSMTSSARTALDHLKNVMRVA